MDCRLGVCQIFFAALRRDLRMRGMSVNSRSSDKPMSPSVNTDSEMDAYLRADGFTSDPAAVARTREKIKAWTSVGSEELFKEADVHTMGQEVFLAIADPFANIHATVSHAGNSQETFCLGRGNSGSSGLSKVKSMDEIQEISSLMQKSFGIEPKFGAHYLSQSIGAWTRRR